VVERTLAWLNRFRWLTVRYERRAHLHLALLMLACALVCALVCWQALSPSRFMEGFLRRPNT
jgi:hypothetical protein